MLGNKIKALRESKSLTQAQVGASIGVGQNTIAMYESNKLTPPTKRLVQLALALGVQPNELFNCVTVETVSPAVLA
jgi:transcriptional regulator with XRE-family HTH domain